MPQKEDLNSEGKLKRKIYEDELRKLQVELCRVQDWVKSEARRVIIVFEGRDTAGKGGTINALSRGVTPGPSVKQTFTSGLNLAGRARSTACC